MLWKTTDVRDLLHSSSPSLGSNLSYAPFPYPKTMMATTGPVIWRMWDSSALCVRQSKTYHCGEAHWDARLLGSLHSFSFLEERSQWWAFSEPPRGVHATGLCLSPQQPWASRLSQFLQHLVCGKEECHHSEILQKGQGDAIWMYTLCLQQGRVMVTHYLAVPAFGRGWCGETVHRFSAVDLHFVLVWGIENP